MNRFERYDKMVFIDKEKEKEWENMDADLKKFITKNLKDACEKMENKIALDTLCLVIQDLMKRIEILEAK